MYNFQFEVPGRIIRHCRAVYKVCREALTFGKSVVDYEATHPYSCRKASIGSRREARQAGIMPLTKPTAPRMRVAAIRVPGAMIRRMSPASAFLAKALYNVSLPTESATA